MDIASVLIFFRDIASVIFFLIGHCLSHNFFLATVPTKLSLGPLHMSPVNRAGSVSEISPRFSFLRKNCDVFI